MHQDNKCPVCGKGYLKINASEIGIPYYGPAYLTTFSCTNCGFRVTDVTLSRDYPPTEYRAKIRSADDLKIKVIKSSTAIIRIPELKVKMEPGPISQGYITNIEGILQRVEDATVTMKSWLTDKKKIDKCDDVLCKVKQAVNGGLELTFIIEDPLGNSLLISESESDIKRRRMSKRKIEKLRLNLKYQK